MTDSFKVYTPIDNSIYLERPYATAHAIRNALARAEASRGPWRASALKERMLYCSRAVDVLMAEKDRLAQEICWQMGRPIRSAAGELNGFEERARYMIDIAEEALATISCPDKEGIVRYIQREPLGKSLVIAPWNYPWLTAVNSIIPSLLAGNVVLLKHSAQTPLVAERFYAAFEKAGLPDGVFQYLHLSHEDTEQLIKDSAFEHVAFTGSVKAGKKIEQAAAGRFLHLGLELGGKDPAYVRADADIDQAVAAIIDGAFFNAGQSCCGLERLYVHRDIYQAFLAKAVEETLKYKLGRPDESQTTLGPMINAAAADFVRAQIKDAVSQGAKACIPLDHFALDEPGSAYMAPQILADVNHSMRIMTEESFGPVLGIMPVSSDSEAVRLMNDSIYGLSACVFTRDINAAVMIGEQIETGTFFVNRCDYLDPALAWTGVKHSGRGCSLSVLGFAALTRPKSFHIKTWP